VGGPDLPVLVRDEDLEVVADADVVPDAVLVQIAYPLFPRELPVRYKAFYTMRAEQADEALDKRDALRAVGVAPFGRHGKEQRKGRSPVYHT